MKAFEIKRLELDWNLTEQDYLPDLAKDFYYAGAAEQHKSVMDFVTYYGIICYQAGASQGTKSGHVPNPQELYNHWQELLKKLEQKPTSSQQDSV